MFSRRKSKKSLKTDIPRERCCEVAVPVGVSSPRNGDLIFALAFRLRKIATFSGALAFCFGEMLTFLAKLRRTLCFYVESGNRGMAMATAEWRRTLCFYVESGNRGMAVATTEWRRTVCFHAERRKGNWKRTFRVGGVAMARVPLAFRLCDMAI